MPPWRGRSRLRFRPPSIIGRMKRGIEREPQNKIGATARRRARERLERVEEHTGAAGR